MRIARGLAAAVVLACLVVPGWAQETLQWRQFPLRYVEAGRVAELVGGSTLTEDGGVITETRRAEAISPMARILPGISQVVAYEDGGYVAALGTPAGLAALAELIAQLDRAPRLLRFHAHGLSLPLSKVSAALPALFQREELHDPPSVDENGTKVFLAFDQAELWRRLGMDEQDPHTLLTTQLVVDDTAAQWTWADSWSDAAGTAMASTQFWLQPRLTGTGESSLTVELRWVVRGGMLWRPEGGQARWLPEARTFYNHRLRVPFGKAIVLLGNRTSEEGGAVGPMSRWSDAKDPMLDLLILDGFALEGEARLGAWPGQRVVAPLPVLKTQPRLAPRNAPPALNLQPIASVLLQSSWPSRVTARFGDPLRGATQGRPRLMMPAGIRQMVAYDPIGSILLVGDASAFRATSEVIHRLDRPDGKMGTLCVDTALIPRDEADALLPNTSTKAVAAGLIRPDRVRLRGTPLELPLDGGTWPLECTDLCATAVPLQAKATDDGVRVRLDLGSEVTSSFDRAIPKGQALLVRGYGQPDLPRVGVMLIWEAAAAPKAALPVKPEAPHPPAPPPAGDGAGARTVK